MGFFMVAGLFFFKKYFAFKYFYLTCMLVSISSATANNDNTQLSLNIRNAPVTDVFSAIENQTTYTFLFDSSINDDTQKISIHSTNESLTSVLSKIKKQSGIHFEILIYLMLLVISPIFVAA